MPRLTGRLGEFDTAGSAVSQRALARTTPSASTGRAGTTEQFAVTLALAARRLGLPSRVVVGFCPGTSTTVRARDTSVWTEVHLAGGWHALHSTGVARPGRRATVEAPAEAALATAAPPPAARPGALAPSEAPALAVARLRPAPSSAAPIGTWITAAVLIGGGAYVLAALVVPLVRRRARRRLRSPRGRTVGAWEDLIETLTGNQVDPTFVASSAAVITAGQKLSPAVVGEIRPLAALADAARYSKAGPTEANAQSAWWFADRARYRLTRARPRHVRLAIALSPRRIRPRRTCRIGRLARSE